MKITTTQNGFAFVVQNVLAQENSALKAARWDFHGSEAFCVRYRDHKRACAACQWQIPHSTWFVSSQQCSDPNHPVQPFVAFLAPEAREIMRRSQQTGVMSRQETSKLLVPAPRGKTYLPFQLAGIEFALQRQHTLIADEPGLGKTIQAVGFVNALQARKVLVISPASLRRNWEQEISRWLIPNQSEITVVSYEQATREAEKLKSEKWDVLVLDEAHYCKNPSAARTRTVFGHEEYVQPHIANGTLTGGRTRKRGIIESATRVLALTGTPIANRPKDVWPLAHALAPKAFPNYLEFAKRYCDGKKEEIRVKEKGKSKSSLKTVWKFDGQSNLPELGQKLRSSIMIRREKMSVLKDLPAKRRQIIPLDIKSAKLQKSFDKQVGKLIGDQLSQAEGRGDFQAFGKLVQQVVPFAEMAKLRKAIGLEKLPAVMSFLDERLCLDREKSTFQTPTQGQDEKLVVFAHHREVLSTIKEAYGKHCVVFWGGMSDNARAKAVEAFQTDPNVRVFAGQIQASGTGLTLTASSTVIFAELDWVPSNLVQCEDRIHRIGQRNAALAIYLVVDGTLEARMAYLLAEKDEIIRQALR